MELPLEDAADAIARAARPIHGDDELDQLIDLIARSRFVLLGESTHGTREFYEMRAQLTRRLISHHGFCALAVDADWPDMLRVDRYLRGQGDDETPTDALGGFERFPEWRWRNAETGDLVEWLHRYNRHRLPVERAGCYGLDLFAQHASIRAVLSYLSEVDPAAAGRARARYAALDRAAPDQPPLVEACEEEVVEELVEMQRRRAARSGRAPSGEAWFRAIQDSHIARRAEAYYRALAAGAPEAFDLREVQLADSLEMLSAQLVRAGASGRIVVWGHNAHVGDACALGAGPPRQTLGAVLRQRCPRETAIVGFTTSRGTVSCAHAWDGETEIEQLVPPAEGSWEQLFHDTGIPRFMVTSSALRRAVGDADVRPHRAVGAVYRPGLERWRADAPARLADRYDVIVHLDETSALEPLPRAVPETYDGIGYGFSDAAPTAP